MVGSRYCVEPGTTLGVPLLGRTRSTSRHGDGWVYVRDVDGDVDGDSDGDGVGGGDP